MPTLIRYEHGWYVNFTHNGQRIRRRFSAKQYGSIEAAQRAGEEFLIQYTDLGEKRQQSALSNLVSLYLRSAETDLKRSASWVRNWTQMLTVFVNHMTLIGVIDISDLDHKAMRSFRSAFVRAGQRKDSTWEMYRQAISAFLNWLKKTNPEILNVAADSEFKFKRIENPPETLDPEEIHDVLAYCDRNEPHYGNAFRFLLYTGMRLGEFMALTWDQVDMDNRLFINIGSKTNQRRSIPINQALMPILESLPREQESIAVELAGTRRPHRKTYYQALQRALYHTGHKRHSIHSIRHTFCRNLLEAGVEITLVSKLMGHSTITTTMRYAKHFSVEDAKKAIDMLSFSHFSVE